MKRALGAFFIAIVLVQCDQSVQKLDLQIFETSAAGAKLTKVDAAQDLDVQDTIRLDPSVQFQEIVGFGGAFTQSSAWLMQQMSEAKRKEIIESYFATTGNNYSLTRSHINSCDFSQEHYAYVNEGDTALSTFSVARDKEDVIPMILDAKAASRDGFKIIASPWTAPPWMKVNASWYAGSLQPEHYDTWARYFIKYLDAYQKEGIDIWGLTVENEPLGNDSNWESMHYTPEEMASFIKDHLGPRLAESAFDPEVLVYDQNRGKELEEWAEVMLNDPELLPFIHGTAVHWYTSTVDWMPSSLNHTHELAPDKRIIHTEGCIDAEVPHWQDDAWYWQKEATDWGWDWAAPEDKPDHPKYVPVYRYARDIIGCLNSRVEGWIDWNMVLDRQGGPNHASNWCVAPIIVDPESDEVYYTPLYYVMGHFSKFMRPGAKRIDFQNPIEELMVTAVQNPDGSIAVAILNMSSETKKFTFTADGKAGTVAIPSAALQTVVINSTANTSS